MKKHKHKFLDKEFLQKERYKKFLVAMIDKNLTQDDLAKMLGCSDVFVCHLLWGRRKSRDKEKRLCGILGIDYKDRVRQS